MKNILIFGGNGLVGQSFKKLYASQEDTKVFTTSRNPNSEGELKCDITKKEDLKNCFEQSKPSTVINCTNLAGGVNFCENNKELSQQFHFQANVEIGELANEYNAELVLISTDYVFDGSESPYKEEDKTNPLNEYGRNKLAAEQWIQANVNRYVIARTTNVFGWDPNTKTPNFLMQLYFKLKNNEAVEVPSFLFGNPTYANDLTGGIKAILDKKKYGVYHVVGSSNVNRYEWAKLFCKTLGFNESLIKEIAAPMEGGIKRPLISNLNTNKLKDVLGNHLSDVHEGLSAFKKDMQVNL